MGAGVADQVPLEAVNVAPTRAVPEAVTARVFTGSVAELARRTGQTDFEETFVQLAFSEEERRRTEIR